MSVLCNVMQSTLNDTEVGVLQWLNWFYGTVKNIYIKANY